MMTSKERAELRAQANPLDVTLIVGKGGISDTLLDEAVVLLDSHELVKGRVLETSGLTAREASDAICEALGAEGVACVGTKFVIWRKSEKVEQEKKKAAAKKPAKKVSGNYNPVKAGLRARKQAAEQQRKQRKQYFHDKAVSAAIENTDRGGAQHGKDRHLRRQLQSAASGAYFRRAQGAAAAGTGQNSLDPRSHPAAQGRGRRLAGRRNALRAHAACHSWRNRHGGQPHRA